MGKLKSGGWNHFPSTSSLPCHSILSNPHSGSARAARASVGSVHRRWFSLIALLLPRAVPSDATTVLAVRSEDRVVLGADSRIQLLLGHARAARSGCKIHVTRDIVWAQAGYFTNPRTGFDLVSAGTRVFAGQGTLAARLQQLASAVTVPLHRALLSLRAADLEEYNAAVSVPLIIVAAGMDDATPVVAFLQFERADTGLLATKLYRCPSDCSAGVQYVSAGIHREADQMIHETPSYFSQSAWRDGVRTLLEAEAAEHPDKVGPPYSIVEISRSGIQWLDRGACPDGAGL